MRGMTFPSDTPRIGASVLCLKEDKVLLIKRGKAPYAGRWSLPGGSVEEGETPAAAAKRELFEETGLDIRISNQEIDTVDIVSRDEDGNEVSRFIIHVFAAQADTGSVAAGDDASDVLWVLPDALDTLQMTPGTADNIRRWLARPLPL